MKLLYNCFAGISGDMNLAAMLDLGMNEDLLRRELGKLGLDEEFTMKITRDERSGIFGTRIDILLTNEEEHSHSHEQDDAHSNDPEHTHKHKHNHETA
ncbi:MAG: nickel insertion protein, partial [Bacteroidota bacterium]